MIVDYFFLVLSIVFCLPSAQLILDLLEDHTDVLGIFYTYGGADLLDWLRDEDGPGPIAIGLLYLCFCLGLYVVSSEMHAVYTASTLAYLKWSTYKIDKKMQAITEVLKSGPIKCHKHPNTTIAVCLELDGTIVEICPICNPEKAKEYGIIPDNDE